MNIFLKLRKQAKLTTNQMAQAIGMSQASVSQYETGNRTPSKRVIERYVSFAKKHKFAVKLEQIFELD